MESSRFSDNFGEKIEVSEKVTGGRKNICKSDKMLVPADKTSNLYELEPSKYETLLVNNITTHYKKTNDKMEADVNLEAGKLALALEIDDRRNYV